MHLTQMATLLLACVTGYPVANNSLLRLNRIKPAIEVVSNFKQ
jgi:hypothetical protein